MAHPIVAALAVVALSLAGAARADQCQLLTQKQGDKAAAVLRQMKEAASWCKTCPDKHPGKPFAIKKVKVMGKESKMVPATGDFVGVWVNDKMIDLAYTFVRKGPKDDFKNLAKDAGCKTVDVEPVLKASAVKH